IPVARTVVARSGVQAQRRQAGHARSVLVRHDRKPQLSQAVEFEAQVLPLKRRATWAKRVLLDQYLAVTLPSIRGRLHMYLLGSLLLCFFHLIHQTRGLRPVELDHDLLDAAQREPPGPVRSSTRCSTGCAGSSDE